MKLLSDRESFSEPLTSQEKALVSALQSGYVTPRAYESMRERGGRHPSALKVAVFKLREKGLGVYTTSRGYTMQEIAA